MNSEGAIDMGKTSARALVATFMGLIIVFILFNALYSMEWYRFEGRREGGPMEMEQGLSSVRITSEGTVNATGYDEAPWDGGKVSSSQSTVKALLIIGIVMTVIFEILSLIVGASRLIPGGVPFLIGIIAGLAVVLGPVYMMFNNPLAWDKDAEGLGFDTDLAGPWRDFNGGGTDTTTGESNEITYGPMWAFYATIACGAVLFLAGGLCAGIRRDITVELSEEDEYGGDELQSRLVAAGDFGGGGTPQPISDYYVTPEEYSSYGSRYGSGSWGYDVAPQRYGPAPTAISSQARPTFCQHCRQLLKPGSDHCVFCGKPLPEEWRCQ